MAKGFGSDQRRGPMRQTKYTRRSPYSFQRELTPGSNTYTLRPGRRAGISGGRKEQPFPDPPETWTGSLPEWAIYWAHLTMGKKPFQDFEYQYFFDPGMILDFWEYGLNIGIEVQGLYWHYMLGGWKIGNDLERKVRAESIGVQLIFIDEDDALESPIYYLREALAGRDHSRATRGF